jgi:chaperone BCS1
LTDIDTFIASKEAYEKYGIPYRRNYLFHGKPGTGKTSLVNVIANRTKRPIYIISFSPAMTDESLFSAIKAMSNNIYPYSTHESILLLEDVDCVFEARDDVGSSAVINAEAKQEMKKSGVSFSGLLNILNGVIETNGLITFLTTNHIAKLDKALVMPGRIDMMIKFDIISSQQVTDMLKLYDITLSQAVCAQLIKICTKNNLTPAMLSAFMFRHRQIVLTDANYIKLFEEYLSEIQYAIDKKDGCVYHN